LRAKHIHSVQDSELLKSIYKIVEERLVINKTSFRIKIWIKFSFYLSFSCLFHVQLYWTQSVIYFIIAFAFYGFAALLFAFNFSHDFAHNTIFEREKINNFCFISIYTLVGAHGEAWKQRHIRSHHFAPNVEDYDSDLKISKLIRVIPKSQHFWYHGYQHIYSPFA